MSDLRQRMEATSRRYADRSERRTERVDNLARMATDGDVLAIEDRPRLFHRMRERAMPMEAVLETIAAEADPSPRRPLTMFLERIIAESELIGVEFLLRGAAATRSVGRIVLKGPTGTVLGHGTGFLVSPRVLMTNNHVLTGPADALHSVVQFDYLERDGRLGRVDEHALLPEALFLTDEALDVSVVAVASMTTDGRPLRRPWNPLLAESGKALVGEAINIIQHPAGRPQEASVRENRVVDVFDTFLHYSSDTEQGSSGAPAFSDGWLVAALHHSGVPRTDAQDRVLLRDGTVWDGSEARIPDIAWVANEGIRVSSIVSHLAGVAGGLAGEARVLLDELLAAVPPALDQVESGGPMVASTPAAAAASRLAQPTVDASGRATWVIPLEVTVGLGGVVVPGAMSQAPAIDVLAGGAATPPPVRPDGPIDGGALDAARRRIEDAAAEPYLDEAAEAAAIATYYAGIDPDAAPAALYDALSRLVRETHTTEVRYDRARLEHLYPSIDLREPPGPSLRSVYSGKGFEPLEIVRADLEIQARRERLMTEFLATEAAGEERAVRAFFERLEAQLPYNCEHVVPQSWFDEGEPMKGDLHHLFTCESGCNSFRNNIPYFQFAPDDEVVRDDCGRRESGRFEPVEGKGAVARATLYFLLRYPGRIGDDERELARERLGTVLLRWHRDHPVDRWERHRNAGIARVQGDRNPLIDHPEWADRIDFLQGFG